ncbi:MAG: hypothetical protein KDG50_14775 [Chromatiales bacterium]|nr:hypothetical protein [Chromatiales bacterium]
MSPAAAFVLALCAPSARATLLDDGGFDAATSGSQTSNSNWVLTTNFPDTTNAGAQFQTGFANANNTGVGGTQPPGTGTGIWIRSFEGNQGEGGDPLVNADITQSILAPFTGNYSLTFVVGRESNFSADQFGVTLFSSGTGGSASVDLRAAVIPDGNLGGAASGNPGGTLFNLFLFGVSAGDTLTVSGFVVNGRDSLLVGGQSAFLDNFELNGVATAPVPSAFALLALGGLLLGVTARRLV